jgi:hypothetical protein
MLLDPRDAELFFKLNRWLMFYVNQRLKVTPNPVATPEEFAVLPPEVRLQVRDALTAHVELIDSFADENPAGLSEFELDIVRSWRHQLPGRFLVFRELKKHTVFLTTSAPSIAYGVVALTQPFEEMVSPHLPVMVQTVLLPFRGRIVYDGLMSSYNIMFGSGIRRSLNESYREAKQRYGIVESLPMPTEPLPQQARKAKPAPRPPSKEEKDRALRSIIELLDKFCHEHLNDEYAVLCRQMAEKLGRKRPSPLLKGRPNAWASGIVRAVGGVNFLHDKTQTPYMRSTDIDEYFGISSSAGAAKLAMIRKMLKLYQSDPKWTLPSRLDDNLMVWMLEVDGLIIDIRDAPRELQEVAFAKGLIPYIPADRRRDE